MSKKIFLEQRLQNLEAALYSAGRPLTTDDIKPIIRTRSNNVSLKVIEILSNRYNNHDRALEVVILNDGRVAMQLKPEYDTFVKQFNNKPLLKLGPLKTLSYIAFHQPVDQRQVISDRGNHVYNHLRMMENMGLIYRERTEDRRYIITTTSFYGDYFGFSHNPERSRLQLKQIFKQLKITKLENDTVENFFNGTIEGLEELDELKEDVLANSGNGLTHRLSHYASSSNHSSK